MEELLVTEVDERVNVSLRVQLAGERFGYRDGAGVADALRQVEPDARKNADLKAKLASAMQQICSLQSWETPQRGDAGLPGPDWGVEAPPTGDGAYRFSCLRP